MRQFRSTLADQRLETDSLMRSRLAAMRQHTASFIIDRLPQGEYSDNRYMFSHILQHIQDKEVLDLGSGDGSCAVYLARGGARRVHAVDISQLAGVAATTLALLNQVGDRVFAGVMDACSLAYVDCAFDVVVGRAVLHHFDDDHIEDVIREVRRVLKDGGEATFLEPVEDSAVFERLQQLVPAGHSAQSYYRPSSVSRSDFESYRQGVTDAALTTNTLASLGRSFDEVRVNRFGLFIRFDRFTWGRSWGRQARVCLDALDQVVLRFLPFLRRYSRTVVVRYCKSDHQNVRGGA